MKISGIGLVCLLSIFVWNVRYSKADRAGFYSITMTKIECLNVDERYITNLTCYIRAARGRKGLLNVRYTYNNIPQTMFFFKVLHRNSAGIWQTYLIDVKFDICDKGQLESTNPIMKRAIAFFRQYDSTIGQGCPMNGHVNYTDIELDEKATALFPPIIPAGTFMFHDALYHPVTNQTFIELKLYVEIKANTRRTAMDLSMLNMG